MAILFCLHFELFGTRRAEPQDNRPFSKSPFTLLLHQQDCVVLLLRRQWASFYLALLLALLSWASNTCTMGHESLGTVARASMDVCTGFSHQTSDQRCSDDRCIQEHRHCRLIRAIKDAFMTIWRRVIKLSRRICFSHLVSVSFSSLFFSPCLTPPVAGAWGKPTTVCYSRQSKTVSISTLFVLDLQLAINFLIQDTDMLISVRLDITNTSLRPNLIQFWL